MAMADPALRAYATKPLLSSICAVLGFDYMQVAEIHAYPDRIDVVHIDQDGTLNTTEIPVRAYAG